MQQILFQKYTLPFMKYVSILNVVFKYFWICSTKIVSNSYFITYFLHNSSRFFSPTVVSCQENNGVIIGTNCYTVIVANVNFNEANKLCEEIGGKLADIHNLKEQNRLQNIARQKISSAFAQFWLGMTYQPSVSSVIFPVNDMKLTITKLCDRGQI